MEEKLQITVGGALISLCFVVFAFIIFAGVTTYKSYELALHKADIHTTCNCSENVSVER